MTGSGIIEPPFGTHALPAPLEWLRRLGAGMGDGFLARRAGSAIRRLVCFGRPDPFDVEPFPGQRARLYPRDNLSEKRVFTAPGRWDERERESIARAAAEVRATGAVFHFVDAGANAGLYTLAARAAAGPFKGLAIEPDAENLRRLRFNLAASGAEDVSVAPVALSDRAGRAVLARAGANRGEIALAPADEPGAPQGETVPLRPLADLLAEHGFDRVDALKIDIEGWEEPVLAAFLRDAPETLRPALVLIEARRGEETAALALLRSNGYVEAERTKLNAILRRAMPDRARAEPDANRAAQS